MVSPLLPERTISASTELPCQSPSGPCLEVCVGRDLRRDTETDHLVGVNGCAAGSGIIDVATRLRVGA